MFRDIWLDETSEPLKPYIYGWFNALGNIKCTICPTPCCWNMKDTKQKIESRLRKFEGRYLRRILNIRGKEKITIRKVGDITGIGNITDEIKRRWTWPEQRHPRMVLTWNPQGKRKRGRPVDTRRRTVDTKNISVWWSKTEVNGRLLVVSYMLLH